MYFNLSCILFSPSNQNSILEGKRIHPDQFSGLGTASLFLYFLSLKNLKYALKRSTGDDKAYGTLRNQIEANWVKTSIKNIAN